MEQLQYLGWLLTTVDTVLRQQIRIKTHTQSTVHQHTGRHGGMALVGVEAFGDIQLPMEHTGHLQALVPIMTGGHFGFENKWIRK